MPARNTAPAPQAAAPQEKPQPQSAQTPAPGAKSVTDAAALQARADVLWEKAENEWGGYTLVRSENVKGNHTVEEVSPPIERDIDGTKMVVCKHIAK